MELPFKIDKALEGLSKVTLRGGVVGKVSVSVIAVSFAIAAIAWSADSLWVSAGGLVAIFLLAFPMLWRLIGFADRHPQAALLEGAEFLVHQQIVQASKSIPELPLLPAEPVQPEPIWGPAADADTALIPDELHIMEEGKD